MSYLISNLGLATVMKISKLRSTSVTPDYAVL